MESLLVICKNLSEALKEWREVEVEVEVEESAYEGDHDD
jgi:hypothetical protein